LEEVVAQASSLWILVAAMAATLLPNSQAGNLRICIVDTSCQISHTVDTKYLHWRRAVRATVKKWGNSAAVRIPASIMQATRLRLDVVVDVREEAGRIVIEPIPQKTYDLNTLLNGITSKNQHEAVEFGPAVGKEVW
jgi:antitoxin MazE